MQLIDHSLSNGLRHVGPLALIRRPGRVAAFSVPVPVLPSLSSQEDAIETSVFAPLCPFPAKVVDLIANSHFHVLARNSSWWDRHVKVAQLHAA